MEAPGPSAAPPGAECFPACRSGYVCHLGQCISACNPLCAADQICTADGECVSNAPMVATPAPPAAPAPPAPGTLSYDIDDPFAQDESAMFLPATRVGGELGVFAGPVRLGRVSSTTGRVDYFDALDLFVTTFSGKARVRLDRLLLHAELPVVLAHLANANADTPFFSTAEAVSVARPGNPVVGASGLIKLPRAQGWISLGGELALPVATVNRNPESQDEAEDTVASAFALAAAVSMSGWWDSWRYAPDAFVLAVPAHMELGTPRVRFGADAAFAYGVPVRDNQAESGVVVQVGGSVQAVIGTSLRLGGRLRVVVQEDKDDSFDDDNDQVSIEPTLDWTIANHGYLTAGLLINLDEPDGLASNTATIWALRVGGGFHH